MCLQWCHINHQLIDNDVPCEHCAFTTRFAFNGVRCEGCRHLILRTQGNICALTHMAIPRMACCHYNCTLDTPDGGRLRICPENLAPGLLARYYTHAVAGLFDRSETATEDYERDGDCILVALADLAVPDVYGLTLDKWDKAFE
jgi:hypothetical protein